MSSPLALFIGLTLTFTGVVVVYVANVRVALDRSIGGELRWNAFVLAPVRAWQLGARALPAAFGTLLTMYLLLTLSTHWVHS